MEMLDKRLNDKGKNWRHVFKVRLPTVQLCDVLSQTGTYLHRLLQCSTTSCTRVQKTSSFTSSASHLCTIRARSKISSHQSSDRLCHHRDNIYVIKTLKEFQYIDDFQKDQGANVRQKAKDITNLLQDDARLRTERKSRATMRDRMVGGVGDDDDEGPSRRSHSTPPQAANRTRKDDDELNRALEASKRSLEADRLRQQRKTAEWVS